MLLTYLFMLVYILKKEKLSKEINMLNVSPEKLSAAQKRAEEIIKKLSLAEKSGQLSQFGTSIYNNEVRYFEDHYEKGTLGSYLTVGGAEITNRLQKECKEKFPTHIPILFADDVIHGYKTIFPTPLAQSASWEPEAAKKGAAVAAKEDPTNLCLKLLAQLRKQQGKRAIDLNVTATQDQASVNCGVLRRNHQRIGLLTRNLALELFANARQ
jgi:hypothetical protein